MNYNDRSIDEEYIKLCVLESHTSLIKFRTEDARNP